ncbi:MAG: hypothetical protein IKN66_08250 [Ruminococcus sp.]|nr:hypothetical protein [Ruminococcus sp.]
MKKYEDRPMNYDENGLYPDEKPEDSKRFRVLDKISGILVLMLFAVAVIYIFVMGSRSGEQYKAIYAFFALFGGIGLIVILTDLIKGKKLQSGAFVALAIGIAGFVCTRIVLTGGDNMKMKLVKLFACGIPLFFACLGAYHASAGIKHALVSKDNCTVSVSAVCKSVTTETTSTNNRITSIKYRPTYEYTYEDKTYTAAGGRTSCLRVIGDTYDIFIDPEKPTLISDPEAEKESLGGALLRALFLVGGPLALMALFIYAFNNAGI